MDFKLADRFNKELPADLNTENTQRQVREACFSYVIPKKTSGPTLIHVSPEMLENLGLTTEDGNSSDFLNMVSGNELIKGSKPYAMCYGGHQFGNWAGQLGDGRAINLCEVAHNDRQWAIQLKGAGKTPYSRSGDGLAVLRSSIREYLCSEAMHNLGVPTTRALSLVLSGDEVLRDVMYNGNAAYEKGAIVARVAPSFLRFGSYEIFSARGDKKTLKKILDYTIKNHFSYLQESSKEAYVGFLKEVADKSLKMVMHWQRVGFVHGVMNTDNMSVHGLTMDYGPYGWLEGYDPDWTPNTTDRVYKRYRFGAQPQIVLWNLFQLANAIYPMVGEAEPLEGILHQYRDDLEKEHLNMMRAKLGLENERESDNGLIEALEKNLLLLETDMTVFYRTLSNIKKEETNEWLAIIRDAFYAPNKMDPDIESKWANWFLKYGERLSFESSTDEERKEKMDKINPKYVLRNYMAQLAIDDADNGDYGLIGELFDLLKRPYDDQPENEKWFAKRPEWARDKIGCSMLSCSS